MMAPEKRLSPAVQRWIFKQGWSALRDVQVAAIQPVMAGDRDLVISAATAAGKTEAFFLPACSAVDPDTEGFSILYISPLKALINDQYRRLESLCELTGLSLVPWHGDVSQSVKQKARKKPHGILLITPESLEAMLIRRVGWMQSAFASLRYCVIDEFHAFIGTERGQQLISLLDRLQAIIPKPVPRIALSATLGDLKGVGQALRPGGGLESTLVDAKGAQTELCFQLRGYMDPDLGGAKQITEEQLASLANTRIQKDLYRFCRGGFHLIFANSRGKTELLASSLRELSEHAHVPNEFFPHHGSLAKELRQSLEKRMQVGKFPTSAICTMTLELGIDIGKVDSVVQVGVPHSVSSLRQRLGRSGRRGSSATLRMLIQEKQLTPKSSMHDRLRLELFQSIAMIRLLLLERWYEPPDNAQYHFSTLLHQILALIAQWGGVRADQLYRQLCQKGPFKKVSVETFTLLLRHMGETFLISQMGNGELVLGLLGEEIVNDYTFYAAFNTPDEFRLIEQNRTLGTISMDNPIIPGQLIIFAGKRWCVLTVDDEKLCIYVARASGGKPPRFDGNSASVHKRIHEEMYRLYCDERYAIPAGDGEIDYLNEEARQLFQEGIREFQNRSLEGLPILEENGAVYLFPWSGDKVCFTLFALLISQYKIEDVDAGSGVVEVLNTSASQVVDVLRSTLNEPMTGADLAKRVPKRPKEKFDHLLPDELLETGFGARFFDIDETKSWIRTL
ncbi:DEAD/DEAH box helicase [Marinobacterium sedimentorum]|uniref:DEAD/DEAH box helicase n=1 Tax=Marinobacterium sedimentorum TaxID=2927804 RepID=UPI0020C62E8A|nr:DEAD/DEAH box helicase [Marinobacterium sedimentorum]MCP8687655.1 DEAD/DEAH box helicase [Marinobacterium sedimentorum]